MITTKKIADYLSFPSFFPARSSIIAPVSVCVVVVFLKKFSVFTKSVHSYFALLSREAEAVDFLQALTEARHEAGTNGEGHEAVAIEGLREDGGGFLLHDTHDLVHQRIFKGDGDLLINRLLDDGGGSDGFCGCGLVGLDEPAGAKFDSAEIADNKDEDVGQFVAVDLSEDGFPCSSAGLAVVVGSEGEALMAKHIGVANVAGIVVFLLVFFKDVFYFLNVRNRKSEGKELASLLRILPRGRGRYGQIRIKTHFNSVYALPVHF